MSVDSTTVRRIARLARIKVAEDEIDHLKDELSAMLAFVEQLSEVDVTGVEPMTSVTPTTMRQRADEVTDGGIAEAVLRNAPARQGDFFMAPKGVEGCAKNARSSRRSSSPISTRPAASSAGRRPRSLPTPGR